ncbi:hypothetical protein CONLIGDRAFT_164957 [Coniochaeta ligniaria NRRL 30616]|uniref:Uncharacterized protein n=1 Tax=Coniochaeta ligniaria NRRL 30616 TaxID=1408157 RepID=A0A1J7J160_9PEZI|nr:hypothetical protein CONLIGDRAFT_164957 [Coniochaeta ligniaria NRRL 30616]
MVRSLVDGRKSSILYIHREHELGRGNIKGLIRNWPGQLLVFFLFCIYFGGRSPCWIAGDRGSLVYTLSTRIFLPIYPPIASAIV